RMLSLAAPKIGCGASALTGTRRTSGLPRFVTSSGSPVEATRSMSPRHVALNFAAAIYFM
ncbi:hypothetical protein LXA38_17950, partial [Erwinia amylovora]